MITEELRDRDENRDENGVRKRPSTNRPNKESNYFEITSPKDCSFGYGMTRHVCGFEKNNSTAEANDAAAAAATAGATAAATLDEPKLEADTTLTTFRILRTQGGPQSPIELTVNEKIVADIARYPLTSDKVKDILTLQSTPDPKHYRQLDNIINLAELSCSNDQSTLDTEFECCETVRDRTTDEVVYWVPFLISVYAPYAPYYNSEVKWERYALYLTPDGKTVFNQRMDELSAGAGAGAAAAAAAAVAKGGRKSRKNRALTKRRTLQNRRRYSTNTKGKKMRRRSRHRI